MLATSDDRKPKALDLELHPPQKIACGKSHTLYLAQNSSQDGSITGTKVFGWGGNRNKQLGLSPHSRDGDKLAGKPVERLEMSTVSEPSDEVFCNQHPPGHTDPRVSLDLFEVACGSNHSILLEKVKAGDGGLLKESRVWSFGLNANGQLGRRSADELDGSTSEVFLPGEVQIPDVMGHRVVVQRICCGTDHTLAIANCGAAASAMGRVFAWGLASYGALGTRPRTDASTPNEVWFPLDIFDDEPSRCERTVVIQQVAAGTKHSVALGGDGRVYTWGHGANGRLGLGHSTVCDVKSYSAAFEPRCIDALRDTRIKYIAVGEAHTGAVDQLGGLHTWGQGSHGRCGHGLTLDSAVPMKVEALTGVAIKQIAFGLMHSVAITMKGQLYAWGKGPATGLDANNNSIVPAPRLVEMPDRDPVYQIAAGPLHTVVLMFDGTLYCFGSASEGRLPFKLPGGAPGVLKDQTFPKKLDAAKGWSQEWEKAIGHKAMDKAKASGEEKAKDRDWWPCQICSGGAHSAVLLEGEHTNLWFWGSGILSRATKDTCGQNDGERECVHHPALLKRGFLYAVKMVAIGLEHCLAITIDGQMYSWGNGDKGQLGTGNLWGVAHPQPIGHPTDVICISAGEEHSACIIEGGESYLWGNAEGGRLGLGNCLSEGVQLMPKQVVITDTYTASTQAVLLRSVACGSQHTAFISEDNRLLTFGMGWFGRLGHGNSENQYNPRFVRSLNVGIRSVHCAAYHTCIVDESNVLWVCGRDSCICRDGMGHQIEPIQFEPFLQEPRRYISSLATSEEHTLAITFQEGGGETSELWVWGKNNRGQLGLPVAAAPRIDTPWQLRIPDLERHKRGARHELRMVSTAPGHSLCLAVLTKHGTQSRTRLEEPVLYAWGYSGSGRLGLAVDAEERLHRQHERGVENSQLSGSPQVPVYPPVRVDQRWKPEETVRRYASRAPDQEEEGPHLAQASQTWFDAQLKLFREPPNQKTRSLIELGTEVSTRYKGFMNEILGLWDRPPPGSEIQEYNLRQKQREIEAEYIRLLNVLKLGMSMCAPRIQGRVKTDEEVLQQMHRFEQLVWVLRQQPLYMANLAACLWGKKVDDPEAVLFQRIAEHLYWDLKDGCTLHLFKSLLRVMIEAEMVKASSIEEVFDLSKSLVVPLFTQLCTNIHFIERIAMPIVDPERESSLVSIIIHYTICRDDETPRSFKTKHQPDFSGVFVCKWKEYEDLLSHNCPNGGEKENKKRSRQHFANELRYFKELCIKEQVENEEADDQGNLNKGKISEFIAHFVKDIIKKEEDLRMLLVCAFTHLSQRGYVINQKADDGDAWKPGICAPITTLVLYGILGGVLHAVHDAGPFSLVRLKIRQAVRRKEAEIIEKWNRNWRGKREEEVDYDTEGLLDRVFFNIQALANFFRRVVSPKGYSDFSKDGAMEKEEPMSRDCAQMLLSFTNESLLGVLQERGLPGSKNPRRREYDQDVTEMQLTVDLYTAHYSLRKTVVWFTTEDLLELTNLLWKYMKPITMDTEGASVCVCDTDSNDIVCQLVTDILPVPRQKGSASMPNRTPWCKEGHLWLARDHGEAHNLTLPTRFLEFQRTGEAEPTFCEVSQAPIPRFMSKGFTSKDSQKVLRTLHAVKPFRTTQLGTCDENFEILERLLQDLSGTSKQHGSVQYRIDGKTFLELQNEFQEFQQKISQDVEEGRVPAVAGALLQRLEDGRRMIDKIREVHDERSFLSYIDMSLRQRGEYHEYLFRIRKGAEEVQKAEEKYKQDLKSQYAVLSYLYTSIVTCDIPEDILSMAQQHSERLAFERAKVKKSRMRRNHPTPAQRVLESLKNETPDGKITDDLRDKVGVPVRSFKLRDLERKGVIVRIHEQIPDPVQQQMCFTFQFKDEGYIVQAFTKTTLLKQFTISRQDIQLFQAGRKPAVLPYGDKFVWVNCFRLHRLLAWIYAEGAL